MDDINLGRDDETAASTIVHVVRFKLKSNVEPTRLQAAIAQLNKMGREITSVRNFMVGKDVGGDYELAAFYQFDDLPGYAEYLMSPIHRNVDDIGLPLVDDMVSFDIAGTADPEIAENIAELHRARYAGDKALAKLVGGLKSFSGSGLAKR